MPDIAYRMQDVRWVSSIVSSIDLMYAGAISVPEMQKKCPFMLVFCIFKYKMVYKEYAGYCIPDAKCETSFWHSFRHLFNLFQGNLQDQKCKKWSFIPIYNLFKYKWYLIEMPDNAYRMQDVRWVSGIFSGIDLMYSGETQDLGLGNMGLGNMGLRIYNSEMCNLEIWDSEIWDSEIHNSEMGLQSRNSRMELRVY